MPIWARYHGKLVLRLSYSNLIFHFRVPALHDAKTRPHLCISMDIPFWWIIQVSKNVRMVFTPVDIQSERNTPDLVIEISSEM